MNKRSDWYRIRKEMFEQVLAEVHQRLGPENAELRAYRQSYEKDLDRRWVVSSRDELLAALQKADILLWGDFHALQQSQKTHLRLLQALVQLKAGPFVLGLECIPSGAQKILEAYLSGDVSEKEFLKKVAWKSWGFPWEHYAPLFQWARKNKAVVIALDDREAKMKARDRAAARRILSARKAYPEHKIIVIYGDLHLSSDRMPMELKKQMPAHGRVLRVFQNSEQAGLRLLKKGLDHKVDVVRGGKDLFSIQNVPPWVKWQNYLLWLDQNADLELEDDEIPDLTDPVAKMVRWIASELRLAVDPAALTIYTADDPELWERVQKTASENERPWLEAMIEDGRSFYLSAGGWGYLARPSVNHAASLAMQFIHDQLSGGAKIRFRMPEDFQKMIWIETMAFFGSKIVNPKRKSDTLTDIRASLSSRQQDDGGREALRLALSQKMTEMMSMASQPHKVADVRPRRKASWVAASHLLGALLGERMYNGYRKGLLSRNTVGAFLRKPIGYEGFSLIYFEALEIIEALPAPFRSKKEKL